MSGFVYGQLDARTRELMLHELELDRQEGRLYIGKRLNDLGAAEYISALEYALRQEGSDSITARLEPVPGTLWIEGIVASNGRRSTTPRTAAETLADGEFNRYYMRAICQRAFTESDGTVVVRRAKNVTNPRADHLVKVNEGDQLDASQVLADLRLHPGEETDLGMPRGPNSGLSLEFTPA